MRMANCSSRKHDMPLINNASSKTNSNIIFSVASGGGGGSGRNNNNQSPYAGTVSPVTTPPRTIDWYEIASIPSRLSAIEQKLAIIIIPNERLETEWQELRELGDKYRKLEQEILKKEKLWEIIKK